MHLNGELEPRVLVELFSILSKVGAADAKFDESVLTSRTIASKVLYCLKNKDYDIQLWIGVLVIYLSKEIYTVLCSGKT